MRRSDWHDALPAPARSAVYDPPQILTRTPARRGYVRRTGPAGEHVPGGIIESIASGHEGLLSCQEVERGLIDAAEQAGLPKTEKNIRVVELGPTPRQKVLEERERRGLISYRGKSTRRQRHRKMGKLAP